MSRKLPPLNAVKAFEAAARHLSFKRAADELCVTPAAVSQQVKSLEEYLSVTLFKREHKGLLLTEAAQRCLPGLQEGFDRISKAIDKISPASDKPSVTVMVSPSFASKWLVPRLDEFHALHPEIQVRVSCVLQQVGLQQTDGDVAVSYDFATANQPGYELLFREFICPVWSPRLLKKTKVKTPQDLKDLTLIHDENMIRLREFPTWDMWLENFGVDSAEFENGSRLPLSSMAIEAAISGQGVALGRSVLVDRDIKKGQLTPLNSARYPEEFGYFLEQLHPDFRTEQSLTFVSWLREQAREMNT